MSHEDADLQLNGWRSLFKKLSSKIWAAIFDYTCFLSQPTFMEMQSVCMQEL